jgi:serine/threonine protein kinase
MYHSPVSTGSKFVSAPIPSCSSRSSPVLRTSQISLRASPPKQQQSPSTHVCLTEELQARLPTELSRIYELVNTKELGRGSFARIRHIRLKNSHTELALKSIEKRPLYDRCMSEQAIREVEFQQRASSHRNIVFMCDVYEDTTHIHMVLEYCPFSHLGHLPQPLSGREALSVLSQMSSALSYLHDVIGVAHRDVKPDNILIMEKQPALILKLTDFGWCAPLSGAKLFGKAGSAAYMAPEVISGGYHGASCDVWSLGVTLKVLLGGKYLNTDHKSMVQVYPSQRPTSEFLASKYLKNS